MVPLHEIQDLLSCDQLRSLEYSWVEADQVVQPYRDLLCHDRDMTSTLAGFHEGSVSLHVFQTESEQDAYLREVLLRVGEKAVEYGVIRIYLENFPAALREAVVAAQKPLGSILNESGLSYSSEPGGFLKISGQSFQPDFFLSLSSKFLFGRYNLSLIHI